MSRLTDLDQFARAGWDVRIIGGGDAAVAANDVIEVALIEVSSFDFSLRLRSLVDDVTLDYLLANDEAASDAADVLIALQPGLSPDNFRFLIRDILRAGGSVSAWIDDSYVPVSLEPQAAPEPRNEPCDMALVSEVAATIRLLLVEGFTTIAERDRLFDRLGARGLPIDDDAVSGSFTFSPKLNGVWYADKATGSAIAGVALIASVPLESNETFIYALAANLDFGPASPKDDRWEWETGGFIIAMRPDEPEVVNTWVIDADAYDEFFG